MRKSYLCIVSKVNGNGKLGCSATAKLVFRPGLMGYKFIMTKELEDGSLMGIYETQFSFMVSGLIRKLKETLEADAVVLYDPLTKMYNATSASSLQKLENIIKSIRSEPALI